MLVKKMKKILLILLLFLIIGCEKDLNNTPTKRVEVFLGNYQSLSDDVQAKIISDVEEMTGLTEEEKEAYIDLWKRHFQGLTYEIKDEKIDGDDATVTAQIEITDYSKIMEETNMALTENPERFQDELGAYSFVLYNNYRLNALKEASDRVQYTIDFKLKKINKNWVLEDLSEEENLKLSGMYK